MTVDIPRFLVEACSESPGRLDWLARLPSTVRDLSRRWSLDLAAPYEHARRHRAAKRGDGATLVSLDDDSAARSAASDPRPVDLLALDEALERLAAVDARKARAMELKYFGGLEMAEIAEVLNLSIKTVEKDVRLGITWLRSALSDPSPHES